ncbi:MAG: ATP-binding protein, partial [Proteobacteria bacterium]|nr:ATP-binding protein [Pseudomonadota bacterium]
VDGSSLQIEVEDNGPGIPAEQVDSIFHRGVRGEAIDSLPVDEQRQGHGLGLSIVRHLVAAYQGELSVKQSPLGGARITIKLPIV